LKSIVLAGGSGTRLWPISRKLMPKQFVRLFDEYSLFQKTILRNQKISESQLVISNQDQYFLAYDQLESLGMKEDFLLEPVGRNTAPAIALACMALDCEDIVMVSPSDHLISDEKAYVEVVNSAKEYAKKGYLVTFGIKPTYAETGYGYIEANEHDVLSFKEKPDEKTAKMYIEQGNYYWNSGIFCFKVSTFLEELEKYSPEIYTASKRAYENCACDGVIRVKKEDMLNIPEDSIDYAVMEKSTKVKVVPSNIGWSDLGSFDALYEELPKDDNQNTVNDHAITIDSKKNLIISQRKVALIDIDDLIVVDTEDALLISKKGSSQKVKEVVKQLKEQNSELSNTHLTVHRPWGTYTELENGNGYKIKNIEVKPGKRLSLQKHFHRNEHWVVVSGTAQVTVGDKSYLVRPNESTYIKMGEIHRLENPGKIPVVMIEVQVGEYTGEDDIVRIEDDFKRS
jgi:mannose-1-phosphate guanylyltransferase